MAWYPGAVKKEIRPGANDPVIIPLGIILHTDSGNSGSLFNYFNGPSGGIESHFHIPKKNPVEQYRDTGYEADANLKANSFYIDGIRYGFISVETQGYDTDPWNDYQLAEIKKLILWGKSVHPRIQLRVCPGPFSAGIGYHTLFGSPGPWTPVAKTCPGPVRIKQFNDVLVPWFKTATPPTEDDMPYTPEQLQAIAYNANKDYGADLWAAPGGTGTHFIADTKAGLASLTAQVAGLTAAVKALADHQGVDSAAVISAVQTATQDALADLKITLAVDDGTPAP